MPPSCCQRACRVRQALPVDVVGEISPAIEQFPVRSLPMHVRPPPCTPPHFPYRHRARKKTTTKKTRDRFAGNLQQDAHEFLSDLINVLHEETHPRLDAAAASVPPKTSDVDGLIALLIESNKTTATNITNTTDDKKGGGRVEDDDGVTTRANSPQSGVVDLSCCEISRDEGLLPRAVGDGDGSGGLCEGEKVVDGDGYVRKDHNSTSGGGSGGDRRAALGEAKGVGALKSGGGGDGAHDDTSGEAKAEQVVGRIPPGEGKEAEAAAAAIKERFMPTTRHFHSELEVKFTMSCE